MLRLIRGGARVGSGEPHDDLAPLVAGSLSGDERASQTLLHSVSQTVLGAVRVVLGTRHAEVEDVTQDALLAFLRALPRFRGECTVQQFASRVGVFTAMAARRKQRTRERWVIADQGGADQLVADGEASPLARLEAEQRRRIVRSLLDDLAEPIAEAMILHFMLGHTVQEVAAIERVPVNTVWSRLRIGKERLRQRFGDESTSSLRADATMEVGE